MTFTLHGLAVSGGIAIGHAYLVSHATLEVAHYAVTPRKVEDEILRLSRAFDTVRTELAELPGAYAPPAGTLLRSFSVPSKPAKKLNLPVAAFG